MPRNDPGAGDAVGDFSNLSAAGGGCRDLVVRVSSDSLFTALEEVRARGVRVFC